MADSVSKMVESLTDFEKTCFDYFAFNYQDLESNLEDNANFIDFSEVTEKIPMRQLRGVMSSMKQKGLVFFAYCDEFTFYLSHLAVAMWFYMNYKDAFNACPVEVLERYGIEK